MGTKVFLLRQEAEALYDAVKQLKEPDYFALFGANILAESFKFGVRLDDYGKEYRIGDAAPNSEKPLKA